MTGWAAFGVVLLTVLLTVVFVIIGGAVWGWLAMLVLGVLGVSADFISSWIVASAVLLVLTALRQIFKS